MGEIVHSVGDDQQIRPVAEPGIRDVGGLPAAGSADGAVAEFDRRLESFRQGSADQLRIGGLEWRRIGKSGRVVSLADAVADDRDIQQFAPLEPGAAAWKTLFLRLKFRPEVDAAAPVVHFDLGAGEEAAIVEAEVASVDTTADRVGVGRGEKTSLGFFRVELPRREAGNPGVGQEFQRPAVV